MDFKKLATILGLIITLSTIITLLFKLDNRFAKANEVKELEQNVQQSVQKIEQRLDLKILEDRLNSLRERRWSLEDRYGLNIEEMPQEIRDEYRRLSEEMDKIKKAIEKLTPKIGE